jgi:hypothetical protein
MTPSVIGALMAMSSQPVATIAMSKGMSMITYASVTADSLVRNVSTSAFQTALLVQKSRTTHHASSAETTTLNHLARSVTETGVLRTSVMSV